MHDEFQKFSEEVMSGEGDIVVNDVVVLTNNGAIEWLTNFFDELNKLDYIGTIEEAESILHYPGTSNRMLGGYGAVETAREFVSYVERYNCLP